MSSLIPSGSASGTGSVTLLAPNTNSNQILTLPDATATLVATGTTPTLNGITFPATQVPSADANTLDDYEEGSWTPTYFGGTTAGTTTYNDTYGRYTKVGRLVTASFSVSIASVTGTGSGRIGNLPFTIGSNAGGSCSVMTRNLNWTDGDTYVIGYVPSDSTSILFYSCKDNSTWNAVPIDGDMDMYATIVYQSA